MKNLKPLGIFFLVLGFFILEVNFLVNWYFPYMDYDGIELVYLVAFMCRIILYTSACVIYDNLWVKYISHNTKEYRQGLIKLYQDQKNETQIGYMTSVLNKAILSLQSGTNPTEVEDWVVKMEKEYRRKI